MRHRGGLTRRGFLKSLGGVAAAIVLLPRRAWRAARRRLSGYHFFGSGLSIAPGEEVVFDPRRTTTVEVEGNVVDEGTLRMGNG